MEELMARETEPQYRTCFRKIKDRVINGKFYEADSCGTSHSRIRKLIISWPCKLLLWTKSRQFLAVCSEEISVFAQAVIHAI